MATVRIRYLTKDRDRHGNIRYYVRRPGVPKIRIRAEPGTSEFSSAYDAALKGQTKKPAKPAAAQPGSFRKACTAYYASPSYNRLDISTRNWQRRALDGVSAEHGDKPVAAMQARHVRKLRDAKGATPGAANTLLKALRALFGWAVEADLCETDPTRDVKRIRYVTKGHHSWTLNEVERFETRHPLGSKARLAMALMLYTTGRREDAVRLGPEHCANGRVRFTQAKNEHRKPVEIDIPMHPDLGTVIAASPTGANTFLVTEYGQPFSAAGFGNRFRT